MRRLQVALLALVALVAAAVSCGGGSDCAKSADIQVTVAAASDISVGDIVRLHVMLSVADGPVRAMDITPDHEISSSSAFILRPDPAPADTYDVSLTVQAFNTGDSLVAIGAESMQAVVSGCNRMTVHLAAVPVPPAADLSFPPGTDLAGVLPPDMAGCIGGTPDEDSDGRANICDLCPADADSTPVDSDGDGLPDACDPDPTMATNKLIYFEPFDTAPANWSGNNPVMQSYMLLDTHGVGSTQSSDATDMLPLTVRVQTIIFPVAGYGNNGGDTGIFVGTSANMNQGTGVYCSLTSNSGAPDTLDLYKVMNGGFGIPTTTNLATELANTSYRIRLTQRGGNWTCEALQAGQNPVSVTTTQTVTAPLYMTLANDNLASHIHSVVAETKLP
jgi:hypothetical protein